MGHSCRLGGLPLCPRPDPSALPHVLTFLPCIEDGLVAADMNVPDTCRDILQMVACFCRMDRKAQLFSFAPGPRCGACPEKAPQHP